MSALLELLHCNIIFYHIIFNHKHPINTIDLYLHFRPPQSITPFPITIHTHIYIQYIFYSPKHTMSSFVFLPSELITAVFEKLEHIDDAINLANCCGTFKAHLAAEKDIIRVTRAILGNSDAHEKDIQLCCLAKGTSVPSPEHGSSVQSFLSCYTNEVDQLDDDDVLAIIGSRQKIRPVQSVYLNHSIQRQYRISSFPSGRRECDEIIDCMFRENALAESDTQKKTIPANRFSDAVVALWVIIGARKLIMDLGNQRLEDHSRYNDIMASFWRGSGKRTLLQTLDVLEVHDFLYGFLIRKMYYRAWSEEEEERQEEEETEPIDKSWARNLQLLGLCLNPTNAAQIGSLEGEISDPTRWKKLPLNQTGMYLQYLEIPAPLSNYGIETVSLANLLEFSLGYELLRLEEAQGQAEGTNNRLVEAWAHFRRNWPTTARGSIFQSLESSEEFLEELRRWVPEPESSPALEQWEDPFSVSLSRKALENWRL